MLFAKLFMSFSSFDENHRGRLSVRFLFQFRATQSDGFIKLSKHCVNENIMVLFVFLQQTDIYGCISEVVKTKLFQLKRSGYENKLHVEAKIKEEDTGMNHLDERAMQ